MAMYMHIDGIKGDVESEPHKEFIELQSFSWGAGRAVKPAKGGAKDREGSETSVGEIHVTKDNDNASTGVLRYALWGKGKKVVIHFARTGDNKQQIPYLKYELEDVLVSGIAIQSGGDRPTETLTLNFTKVTVHNLESKDTNEDGDPDRMSFDLATGAGS